jgi:antibiotic biosynthesis monooxygenase (ABM) superfamily enzyme
MSQPHPGPSLSSARTAPSIHVLAVLTGLAIFPLVAIGITAMAPFTVSWDPLLRVFVLTTVVVPLSVYWVVPWFVRIYDRYLAPRR